MHRNGRALRELNLTSKSKLVIPPLQRQRFRLEIMKFGQPSSSAIICFFHRTLNWGRCFTIISLATAYRMPSKLFTFAHIYSKLSYNCFTFFFQKDFVRFIISPLATPLCLAIAHAICVFDHSNLSVGIWFMFIKRHCFDSFNSTTTNIRVSLA